MEFEKELSSEITATAFHIIIKETRGGNLTVETKTFPEMEMEELAKEIHNSRAFEAGVGTMGILKKRLGLE